MSKDTLTNELNKRFDIKDNKVYLKHNIMLPPVINTKQTKLTKTQILRKLCDTYGIPHSKKTVAQMTKLIFDYEMKNNVQNGLFVKHTAVDEPVVQQPVQTQTHKKRIAPTLLTSSPIQPVQLPTSNSSHLTAGQKRYRAVLDRMENAYSKYDEDSNPRWAF